VCHFSPGRAKNDTHKKEGTMLPQAKADLVTKSLQWPGFGFTMPDLALTSAAPTA
jgi:hypothetical protein